MRARRMWLAGLFALGFVSLSLSDPLPPESTYRPLPTLPLDVVRRNDEAAKQAVQRRQQNLLTQRYDLSNRPIRGVMMSGGRKPVQGGVRVKLQSGMTWEQLAQMTPDEIRDRNLLPQGLLPLPHVKQLTGGQVFPQQQIDAIGRAEERNLKRFDVDFDFPEHLTPEFPAPIFLTTRPELGDVSGGKLLTIRNFFAQLVGVLTPVQMDGLRLLLTPFPQEEFNQTEDRKVAEQCLGVA
jgi:cytochrome c peroxidase